MSGNQAIDIYAVFASENSFDEQYIADLQSGHLERDISHLSTITSKSSTHIFKSWNFASEESKLNGIVKEWLTGFTPVLCDSRNITQFGKACKSRQ